MKWIEQHWKRLMVLSFMVLLGGPLIINSLFKMKAPIEIFIAEWNAGDVLSFYAVIVSSVIAISGISLTIKSSREEQQENTRNSVLPFILINYLDVQTKSVDLLNFDTIDVQNDPEITEYAEKPLTEVYFIISEKGVEIERTLSGHQKTVVENNGLITESNGAGMVYKALVSYMYIPLSLENVGKGAAINMQVGLNLKSPNTASKYTRPVSLRAGDTFKAAIYSENNKEGSSKFGTYEFEIKYSDIYGNRYKHVNQMQFLYKDDVHRSMLTMETIQAQELVDRKA